MASLKKMYQELNLDISHFKGQGWNKENYNYQEKEQTSEISDEVKDNIAAQIEKEKLKRELQKLKEQAYENTMEEERKVR